MLVHPRNDGALYSPACRPDHPPPHVLRTYRLGHNLTICMQAGAAAGRGIPAGDSHRVLEKAVEGKIRMRRIQIGVKSRLVSTEEIDGRPAVH